MTTDTKTAAPERASALAYLFLTITALCWAANAVFARFAVGEVSPMLLVCLRWLTVLLLLAAVAKGAIRRDLPALRERWLYLAAMGTLGFTSFNALYYVAAHTTTAVNIGIIQGALPMFVFLGAFAAYRTPVGGVQLFGAVLTVAGVALVAAGGSLERFMNLSFVLGDVLIILACALYSGYTVALRRRPNVGALSMFAALAGAAFAASLPLVAAEAALGRLQWPTTTGWIIVLLVAVFPSVIAQTCFIKGVSLIGPGRAGVFMNLVPVFAAVMAVVALVEAFEGFHAAALVLVLGGIWIAERGKPVAV